MARFVTRFCRDGSAGKKGATFYHDSMSYFETATNVLKSLDLVIPVPSADKPDETWYCYHALVLDADEIPEFLTKSIENGDDRFPELLQTFLGLACDQDNLPTTRRPFKCPDAYCAVAVMLAQAAFLKQVGEQYCWTDKVASSMRTLGFWNSTGESIEDIEEAQIERESELVLKTMPGDVLRAFESRPDDLLSWIAVLEARWIDGAWQEASDRRVSLPGDIGLARRVMEKFRAALATERGDGSGGA